MKVFFVILALCISSFGANHYVRQSSGCTTSCGGDWNTAYVGFGTGTGQVDPNALVRGDTYYVATGTYSLAVMHTSESGTLVITVKGATAADHGTATGWSNSFGVDVTQATFTTTGTYSPIGIFIWNGYFVLDGNTGTPVGGPTSYGFTVSAPASCASGNTTVEIGPGGSTINNVTISHFYFKACSGNVQTQGITQQSTTVLNNPTYTYNYFDGFQVAILDSSTGLTFDHNYLINAFSSSIHHGNQLDFLDHAVNPVISNNTILNCAGTVCIGANDTGGTCSQGITGGKIYGNVINATLTAGGTEAVGDGIIGSTSRCFISNTVVYNNTFTGSTTGWLQGCVTGQATCASATGNIAENNIVYNQTCALGSGISTNDYNSYLTCSDTAPTEVHGQVATLNPFVSAGTNNFHLSTDTSVWLTLASPYNVDPDGVTRTSSRGAFQFPSAGMVGVTLNGASKR